MTTVLLLLALLKANGTQGITVHVRAVDREALALPGVEITAIEVSECRSLTETSSNVVKDTTGREGVVALTLPRAHAYVIRSGGGNGFEVAETCLPNLAGTEPRYVQLQLRFDPSNTVTHEEPSAEPPERHATLSTFAFAGVYRDARSRYFVVEASANAKGIYMETPDARALSFPRQSGTSFTGRDGRVRFMVTRGRVVSMEFTPAPVQATKRD